MHICFIVDGYPYKGDPIMSFVQNLVVQIASRGHQCTVIAPQSITRQIKMGFPMRPGLWFDKAENNKIAVYQPKYLSFSNYLPKINDVLFQHAVKTALKKIDDKVDVLYAHFWHLGVVASKLGCNCPLIVACGESEIIVRKKYSMEDVAHMLQCVRGVIYVSSKCFEEAVELCLQENEKFIIAPNGFDSKKFFKQEREYARSKLGIKTNDVIGIFVGAFNERKGVLRTQKVAAKIHNLKMIYIGRGADEPKGDNIIYSGALNNNEIVDYLSASDFFVLPTRAEGCCNAIVEAIACGLPIISSNMNFNKDILSKDNSLMIDPDSEDELYEAMVKMIEDETLRKRLAYGSTLKAKELSIEKRVSRICEFMEEIYENYN